MSSGILIYLKIHSPNQSDNLMKHPGYQSYWAKARQSSYLGVLEPAQLCSAQLVLGTDTPFIKSKAKSCHRELTLFNEPFAKGWRVSWVHSKAGTSHPAVGPVWHYLIGDLGAWRLVAHLPPDSASQWGVTYTLCGAASLSRWKAQEETEVHQKDDWRAIESESVHCCIVSYSGIPWAIACQAPLSTEFFSPE